MRHKGCRQHNSSDDDNTTIETGKMITKKNENTMARIRIIKNTENFCYEHYHEY